MLQKLDDFLQFQFRFVEAGHVVEADLTLLFRIELGSALTERHRPVVAALHLVQNEEPNPDDDDQSEEVRQQADPPRRLGWRLRVDLNAACVELVGQVEHGGRQRDDEIRAVVQYSADFLVADEGNAAHASLLDQVEEDAIVKALHHRRTRVQRVDNRDGEDCDEKVKANASQESVQYIALPSGEDHCIRKMG